MDKIAVFSGNAHPELTKDICQFLKIEVSDALVSRFSEGEIRVRSMRMCGVKTSLWYSRHALRQTII